MREGKLAELGWIGDLAAVAGGLLVVELQLQRNHARLACLRVNEAAAAQLAGEGGAILGGGIPSLHHERHGLADHAVKHRAVVDATTHEINKIARR